MAEKKYTKDINKWISLCRLSESERKQKQPKWDEIDNYFRGIQWSKLKGNNADVITVNLVYSHVKVVIPTTYLRYPKIYFTPQSPAAIEGCALLEQVLNADMRKMKLKETNKRILQDVILYGTGFSKTTFEIEEGAELLDEDKTVNEELEQEFYDSSPSSVIQARVGLPKAGPSCIRITPRDVMFSLGITDFGDPGFIGHKARLRLSKVKNNPYYKNTKDLKPNWRMKDDVAITSGYPIDENAEDFLDMIDVYEIWDVDNQKWFTIADGHEYYLTGPEDNPYPVDHPFDRLILTPLEDQIWGFGEIEPVLPQYDELNDLRTQMRTHRRRFNRKYGALSNAFETEDEEAKLMEGEDGSVIKFRGNRPINEQIQVIQDAPIPGDVYKMNAIIDNDIEKIGRITGNRRGSVEGETATEANIAERAASIGDSERLDAVSEFTLGQLEKVRKMRRALTLGKEMIDITGNPMDEERWKYWTREDIDVESMMSIEFGSTQPQNDERRQSKALILYQQVMANPTANPQSALAKLLQAFGEKDIPGYFLPNELIQMQLIIKALGAAQESKGISPTGSIGFGEPGPASTTETPAEVRGRAASTSRSASA